jgi:hypothetical protein
MGQPLYSHPASVTLSTFAVKYTVTVRLPELGMAVIGTLTIATFICGDVDFDPEICTV